ECTGIGPVAAGTGAGGGAGRRRRGLRGRRARGPKERRFAPGRGRAVPGGDGGGATPLAVDPPGRLPAGGAAVGARGATGAQPEPRVAGAYPEPSGADAGRA